MDFTVRASNREAYVAPDRGAQGNALKTMLPMPWVIDPEHGELIVEAHGKRHTITCGADPISQRAVIHDDVTDAKCKNSASAVGTKKQGLSGTLIRVAWAPRNDADVADRVQRLVEGFAIFNPHATIRLNWFGQKRMEGHGT